MRLDATMMMMMAAGLLGLLTACSSESTLEDGESTAESTAAVAPEGISGEPPARIREWMDRLTVDHEYDPETGLIVAREVIELPEVISSGPPLEEAIRVGAAESRGVLVFATADRCAPCQQYKKSALNDSTVIATLRESGLVVTHVEVDREPEMAEAVLGSRAIPMTYLLRDGEVVSVLRGQRSAAELLEWLATARRTG
jgi:hypothetical protein